MCFARPPVHHLCKALVTECDQNKGESRRVRNEICQESRNKSARTFPLAVTLYRLAADFRVFILPATIDVLTRSFALVAFPSTYDAPATEDFRAVSFTVDDGVMSRVVFIDVIAIGPNIGGSYSRRWYRRTDVSLVCRNALDRPPLKGFQVAASPF